MVADGGYIRADVREPNDDAGEARLDDLAERRGHDQRDDRLLGRPGDVYRIKLAKGQRIWLVLNGPQNANLEARALAARDEDRRRPFARGAEEAGGAIRPLRGGAEDLRLQGEDGRKVLRRGSDDEQERGRVRAPVPPQLALLTHPIRVVGDPDEAVAVRRPELAELDADDVPGTRPSGPENVPLHPSPRLEQDRNAGMEVTRPRGDVADADTEVVVPGGLVGVDDAERLLRPVEDRGVDRPAVRSDPKRPDAEDDRAAKEVVRVSGFPPVQVRDLRVDDGWRRSAPTSGEDREALSAQQLVVRHVTDLARRVPDHDGSGRHVAGGRRHPRRRTPPRRSRSPAAAPRRRRRGRRA